MSAAPLAYAVAAPGPAVTGHVPDVLELIREPEIAIAVWHRPNPCPGAVSDAAESLLLEQVPPTCGPMIARALEAAGYGAARAGLAADIADLAARFGRISGAAGLRIRLDRVTTDSCRLFHADYVTMRLLCCFAGPGTEWRVGADGPVNRLADGDVGILKGRLLLDPPPVLHRSPPIAGSGIERVLLAIDALG